MAKAACEEIESAPALPTIAKKEKNTGEKCMIKSPFTSGLNSKSNVLITLSPGLLSLRGASS
jgi:hypothetical protein